jgi:hypothetical protein
MLNSNYQIIFKLRVKKKMAEENTNEEPIFKIADRRKFNADGSLREGVSLEEIAAKQQSEAASVSASSRVTELGRQAADEQEPPEPPPQQSNATMFVNAETAEDADANEAADEDFDEKEIPGAENPASFANFLLSLASQAAAAMGLAENPMTGKRTADLELSRYWLDVLGMLREKTKNNLHPQEQKLFDGLLGDLRMQFVQLARMAEAQMRQQEENLMKQAAQKFSGKDILGK